MIVERQLARVGIEREGAQRPASRESSANSSRGGRAWHQQIRSGERAELMECTARFGDSRVENSAAPPPAALRVMEELFSSRISMSRCTSEAAARWPRFAAPAHEVGVEDKWPSVRTTRATGRVEFAGGLGIHQQAQVLAAHAHRRSSVPEFSSCKTAIRPRSASPRRRLPARSCSRWACAAGWRAWLQCRRAWGEQVRHGARSGSGSLSGMLKGRRRERRRAHAAAKQCRCEALPGPAPAAESIGREPQRRHAN